MSQKVLAWGWSSRSSSKCFSVLRVRPGFLQTEGALKISQLFKKKRHSGQRSSKRNVQDHPSQCKAKPRIPKKRAKAFSAYIERFCFVIVNKMGNWLSLKTFEIQHALYGSRLRLWWVPVTNTHLVSCWGKTNGVLVLLERELVPVSNRTLPSSSILLLHILSQDS